MITKFSTQNTHKCSIKILTHLAENGKANQHQLTAEIKQIRKSCTSSVIAEAVCALYGQGLIQKAGTETIGGETENIYDLTREGIMKVLLESNYDLDKVIDRTIPRLNQHFGNWIKARRKFLGETRTKKITQEIAPLLTPLSKQEEDEKQFAQSIAFITAISQIGISRPVSTNTTYQKTPKHQHLNDNKINQH